MTKPALIFMVNGIKNEKKNRHIHFKVKHFIIVI